MQQVKQRFLLSPFRAEKESGEFSHAAGSDKHHIKMDCIRSLLMSA